MIIILTRKSTIKVAIWPGWSSMMVALLFMWCVCHSDWYSVMCMSSGLGCLISMVCKMRILIMDASYFRHAVWEKMKSICHILMHDHWACCCQCLCSVVGYSTKVNVWFPILMRICFHLGLVVAIDYYDLTIHLRYPEIPSPVWV